MCIRHLLWPGAMDILGVPNDGLEYDFDNLLLSMRDTTGAIVRKIPIDKKGRMYVNYYGYYKTFLLFTLHVLHGSGNVGSVLLERESSHCWGIFTGTYGFT